jgi:hypothetical protein
VNVKLDFTLGHIIPEEYLILGNRPLKTGTKQEYRMAKFCQIYRRIPLAKTSNHSFSTELLNPPEPGDLQ